MENKLQQLTQKLYDEGLEKGRAEAERLVAEAKTNAAKIVKEAEAQAAKILAEANTKAQDVEKNAMTEISLAPTGSTTCPRIRTAMRCACASSRRWGSKSRNGCSTSARSWTS